MEPDESQPLSTRPAMPEESALEKAVRKISPSSSAC